MTLSIDYRVGGEKKVKLLNKATNYSEAVVFKMESSTGDKTTCFH